MDGSFCWWYIMWYNEPSGPGRFIIHNVTVDIILIIVITNTHATSSSRIILSAQCPSRFDSQPFNVYLQIYTINRNSLNTLYTYFVMCLRKYLKDFWSWSWLCHRAINPFHCNPFVPVVSITVLFSAGLDRGDFMMKILFIVYIMINFPLPAVLILESTIYQV